MELMNNHKIDMYNTQIDMHLYLHICLHLVLVFTRQNILKDYVNTIHKDCQNLNRWTSAFVFRTVFGFLDFST